MSSGHKRGVGRPRCTTLAPRGPRLLPRHRVKGNKVGWCKQLYIFSYISYPVCFILLLSDCEHQEIELEVGKPNTVLKDQSLDDVTQPGPQHLL